MISKVLLYIFPPKCIFCGNILDKGSDIFICKGCFNNLTFYDIKSSKYKSIFKTTYCDEVVCACFYEGILKSALVKYKFSNKPSFYRGLAYLLCLQLEEVVKLNQIDLVIAVPLSTKRNRERGYNQAYLIAVYMSKLFRITNASAILRRIKHTKAQSTLHRDNRQNNITGAFVVENKPFIKGKNILILDDVFTTGSTVNECAKVLKEAGANSIYAAVVASSRKF